MEISEKLKKIPPYLFVEIDKLKNEKLKEGIEIIDLGIGDPDLPTPPEIVEVAKKALENPSNHRYPSSTGSLFYRKACAKYMRKRFEISFNPETEILALIGSKEGIAHFPIAFINPKDVVLCPDPAYPVYHLGTIFAGGKPYYVPLTWEKDFLPDLGSIPKNIWQKTKIFWLNYPNNPTTSSATKEFFKEIIKLAKKYDFIIAHDAAYVEIYFEAPSISIFEVEGAKEVAVEFHSLSKTFCMTGWRIGFAVGNEFLISALAKVKSNIDSGVFTALQEAGAYALENLEKFTSSIRNIFKRRRDLVAENLKKLGFKFKVPSATFYLWVKTPNNLPSQEFCKKLLDEKGIVVTPGIGFGKHGEGYFRIALTVEEEKLEKAIQKLSTLKL